MDDGGEIGGYKCPYPRENTDIFDGTVDVEILEDDIQENNCLRSLFVIERWRDREREIDRGDV